MKAKRAVGSKFHPAVYFVSEPQTRFVITRQRQLLEKCCLDEHSLLQQQYRWGV
jgi:hypothetical protein